MRTESKPQAFIIFDEWLKVRGYKKYGKKIDRKKLWKDFVDEVKRCGIIDVFKCSDYNKLKQLLGLSYVDKEGWVVYGPFRVKQFNIGDE